ncbi:MAG: hypothetical protein AAFV69_00275 [Pseudomonadota bacterium]
MAQPNNSPSLELRQLRDELSNVSAELMLLMSAVTGDSYDMEKKAAQGIILVLERQLARIENAVEILSSLSKRENNNSTNDDPSHEEKPH